MTSGPDGAFERLADRGESVSLLDAPDAEVVPRQQSRTPRKRRRAAYEDLSHAVRRACWHMVGTVGACQMDLVLGHVLSSRQAPEWSAGDVRAAAKDEPGFDWLHEPTGWFWLGPSEVPNRTLQAVRKVFVVAADRVSLEELHSAVSRVAREYYGRERPQDSQVAVMPPWVLKSLLQRQRWLQTVQGSDFRSRVTFTLDEFGPAEQVVVKALMLRGNCASRATLFDLYQQNHGGSNVGFALTLGKCPAIVRLQYGIYKLLGRDIGIESLTAALASRQRIRAGDDING